MAETKYQHTVPVCYLGNWGINGNQRHKSEVYFLDVNNRRVHISAISRLPTEKYFYDIPELGEEKQILEKKLFCNVEGDYATLLKKVLQCIEDWLNKQSKKRPILPPEDRNELAALFAMQIVRTQAFRNLYQNVYRTMKEGFPWADIPDYTSSDFQRLHTAEIMSFKLANFYANLLSDRNWVILINHT